MTEKIKEIVQEYLQDKQRYFGDHKYKINSSYWVKFSPTMYPVRIRVYLGSELPGYQFVRSDVYQMSNGPLKDDDKGLVALVEMLLMETEKMNREGVSIGYDIYKSVVFDNDKLREEIVSLKKEVETWKKASIENHNAYLSAMKGYEEYQDKYIKEKTDHTTTSCRIIFAKHILSGNRDERVMEYMDRNES